MEETWKKHTSMVKKNVRALKFGTILLIMTAAGILLARTIPHSTAENKQPKPTLTLTNSAHQEGASQQRSHSLSRSPPEWKKIVIAQGATLSGILHKYHVHFATVKQILETPLANKNLGTLHPGKSIFLLLGPHSQLLGLKYPLYYDEDLRIDFDQSHNKYSSRLEKKALKKYLFFKSITIQRTFTEAALKIGLPARQVHQLITLFSSEVNLSHSIQRGDTLSVLYEVYYLNGKQQKIGDILATRLNNKGHLYTGIRFSYPKNHTGYYTVNGHNLATRFLRSPLKYKRISGYFTLHRYDPILHSIHPHFGIDYAAPRGTPIQSVGDGRLIFQGQKGGYGKTVIIRYDKKYKALYGHLSRFETKQSVGQKIKKGQTIGYVGSSGWATGPHLHFEMYVNGVPKNPLKIGIMKDQSIPNTYLIAFRKKVRELATQLETRQNKSLIMAEETVE